MTDEYPEAADEILNDIERGRGILTQRDRAFLWGLLQDELDENATTQKRYQIRQRLRNGLIDLATLSLWLSHEDWERVLDDVTVPIESEALKYQGIPLFMMELLHYHGQDEFLHMVANLIEEDTRFDLVGQEVPVKDVEVTVDLQIEVDKWDLEDLRARYEANEEMTNQEVAVLFTAGEITEDEAFERAHGVSNPSTEE